MVKIAQEFTLKIKKVKKIVKINENARLFCELKVLSFVRLCVLL